MVALYPDPADARELAQDKAWFLKEKSKSQYEFEPEPPDELHITLAYFPDASQYREKKETIKQLLEALVERWGAMSGEVCGLGYFSIPDGDAVYASFDCPDLSDFRHDLLQSMNSVGMYESRLHGFTPHMTLGYCTGDAPGQQVLPLIGTREKANFLGQDDVEYVGKFKKRDLSMRTVSLRWGDENAGDFKLKLKKPG